MNNKIRRLVSALIDFYIICFLASFSIGIVTNWEFRVTVLSVGIYMLCVFLFVLTKDFAFKNASIGKKLLKLKIIKTDASKYTIIDAVKRTFSLVLLPIEIVMLIVKDQRLGDIWARTIVVSNNS